LANEKPKSSVKNLAQLGSLLREAKNPPLASAMREMVSEVAGGYQPGQPHVMGQVLPYSILPDDEDMVCIYKAMLDGKGRKVSEVMAMLKGTHISSLDIPVMMKLMANTGILITKGSGPTALYTLKKGAIMPQQHKSSRTSFRPSTPEPVSTARTLGRVDKIDGMELALWKVTSDRKARSVKEIGALMTELGFHRGMAQDLVLKKANTHAKAWYDRVNSNPVTYAMRKGIPMPEAQKAEHEVNPSSIAVNSTTTFRERSVPRFDYQPPAHSTAPMVSQSNPQQEEIAVETKPVETPPEVEALKIDIAEGIEVAVWKVMSDYKEYNVGEVGLLLEDYGFNPKTVATTISTLHLRKGWFERKKVEGYKGYVYTLLRDTVMPTPLNQVTAPAVTATPQEDVQPVQQTLPEMPEVTATSSRAEVEIETMAGVAAHLAVHHPEQLLKHLQDKNSKPTETSLHASMAEVGETVNKPKSEPSGPLRINVVIDKIEPPVKPVLPVAPALQPIIEPTMQAQTNAPAPTVTAQHQPAFAAAQPASPPTAQPQEQVPSKMMMGGGMVKFAVQIRNLTFSLPEARQLSKELQAQGFGSKRIVPAVEAKGLLNIVIQIRGTNFPMDQVQAIALELEEAGMADDTLFA
jgi:hypothetical protein